MIEHYHNINFDKYDKTSSFYKELETMFDLYKDVNYPPQRHGNAQCTLAPNKDIRSISNFDNFFTDIVENTLKKEYTIVRTWANKMFYGSSGDLHYHDFSLDKVIIFYYCAEKNAAKFIIPSVEELVVKTGDMIVHTPHMPHAVGVHESDIPRISIMFEVKNKT